MTAAPSLDPRGRVSMRCIRCDRQSAQRRPDHGERVLCDRCANKPGLFPASIYDGLHEEVARLDEPRTVPNRVFSSSELAVVRDVRDTPGARRDSKDSSWRASRDVRDSSAPQMPELLERVARGELLPWRVELAPLPARAGANVRTVADDLERLFGVLAAAGDERPLLYGSRWAAGRLDMDREVVSRALRCLVRAGVIRHVRSLRPQNGGREGPRCYSLGEGAKVYPHGPHAQTGTLLERLGSVEAVVTAFAQAFDATEAAA
jgi:hypothetical protein